MTPVGAASLSYSDLIIDLKEKLIVEKNFGPFGYFRSEAEI